VYFENVLGKPRNSKALPAKKIRLRWLKIITSRWFAKKKSLESPGLENRHGTETIPLPSSHFPTKIPENVLRKRQEKGLALFSREWRDWRKPLGQGGFSFFGDRESLLCPIIVFKSKAGGSPDHKPVSP